MSNIICAGFGGQGVLTAGLILAKIGLDAEKNVSWIPSYGSEMRGGTANCNVKISDEEIASPFVKEIDILMAMNEPSVDKFEMMLKPGSVMIMNSSIIGRKQFRDDVNIVKVPATEIASELSNSRGANLVMLGALIGKTGLFDRQFFEIGIDSFFGKKGKSNPLNIQCFSSGYEFV